MFEMIPYHSVEGNNIIQHVKNKIQRTTVNLRSFKVTGVIIVLVFLIYLLTLYLAIDSDPLPKSDSLLVTTEKELKKILLWNSFFRWPDFKFGFGRQPFFDRNCECTECYVTNDREFVPLEDFDAVVFHGAQFQPKSKDEFPARRSPKQLYVFYSLESPDIFPAYNIHNDLYNTTVTYRLDSDVPFPYFCIFDFDGNYIAPTWNPMWNKPDDDPKLSTELESLIANKTKPAAWFVSRCVSPNKRMELINEIRKNISVDIYGKCGEFKCPPSNDKECFDLLRKDYFFYMSFENSNCVDYVTEKLFNAYTNDVIPVVYNGGDMNRVAPPYSYLDALSMTPEELTTRMKFLIDNPKEYAKYFWWKKYYRFQFESAVNPFCSLCKMLHNDKLEPKTYHNFTDWFRGSPGNSMCFQK